MKPNFVHTTNQKTLLKHTMMMLIGVFPFASPTTFISTPSLVNIVAASFRLSVVPQKQFLRFWISKRRHGHPLTIRGEIGLLIIHQG